MTTTTSRRRRIPALFLILAAAVAGPGSLRASDDLAAALELFRTWKQGSPVSQLAQTRQAVFRATEDPAVRAAHETALLSFLDTGADGQAKQRAIGWLGDVGGDASVPVLANLLDDKVLGSAARGALERIPGAAANKALVGALRLLTGVPRIGVVNSLGRRNEPAGVKALVPLLQADGDLELQRAVLFALGSLDSPEALTTLLEFKAPEALARSHGLAILEAAGRERAGGQAGKAARLYYRQVSDGCDSLKVEALLGFLASAEEAKDPLLRRALADERLRTTAIRRIHAGDGSAALLEELVEALEKDASAFQPPLVHALAARAVIRTRLRRLLAQVIKNQTGAPRLLAIEAFAVAGGGGEAKLLLVLAAGGPQDDKADRAAFATLARMEDPAVDEFLQDAAGMKADPARSATAIKLLGARGGHGAVSVLWAITRDENTVNHGAAIAALAVMLPPEEFPALLDHFLASEGQPTAAAAKSAVWQMLRRLPDQALAIRQVEAAAAKADPESAATLKQMAARVMPNKKKKPAPNPPVSLPKNDDRAALQPNGYRELLVHNAGAGSTTKSGDLAVRRLAGREHAFFGASHPLTSVDFGDEIRYEFTGLDPRGDYVLGLSWWDADRNGRLQELRIDGELALPATPPLAWHADKPTWSRLHLPVPTAASEDGKLGLTITKASGVNAVVSQLWLLQREAKAPATRRVLVVTGDDYPGHRWRETGPELASILRAEPRLEVTISESPSVLASPLLGHYDAVLIHFKNYAKRLPTDKGLWNRIDRFVRDGGGLVVAHFGCGALQEWDGFVKLGGRIWNPKLRGHDPYGEFLVRILNDSHPATRGMNDFTTRDELYTCLDGDPSIEILAAATSKVDKKNYPMAFTVRDVDKGRVFHCPLGHDMGAFEAKGTRQLYRQGAAWAAGL